MTLIAQIVVLFLLAAVFLFVLLRVTRWSRGRPSKEIARAYLLAIPLSLVLSVVVWALFLPSMGGEPGRAYPFLVGSALPLPALIWAILFAPCVLLVLWERHHDQPRASATQHVPAQPGNAAALVNLRATVNQLDPAARAGLEHAAGLCVEAGNYEVALPHLLLAYLETDTTARDLISAAGVDPARVSEQATASLRELPSGNRGRPVLAAEILQLLDEVTHSGDHPACVKQVLSTLLTVPTLREAALTVASDLTQVPRAGDEPSPGVA